MPFPLRSPRRRGLAPPLLLAALVTCAPGSACRPTGNAPGLGELMSLNQVRHEKLWLAGRAANWELAAHEVDELEEGFASVVEFHPTHAGAPLPLSALVPKMIDPALRDLRAAVASRDPVAFERSFDALTTACNGCHRATGFGFNVVRRPSDASWLGDREFAPERRAGAGG